MIADIRPWNIRMDAYSGITTSRDVERAMQAEIDDLRAALEARNTMPEGYALAPIEPTSTIRSIICDTATGSGEGWKVPDSDEVWRELIAATQIAPASDDPIGDMQATARQAKLEEFTRCTPDPGATAMASPAVSGEALKMLAAALSHARDALRFYAEQEHFIRHQPDEWDTVSGEPHSLYEDISNTATVEDGTIARTTLEDIALVGAYASIATNSAAQAITDAAVLVKPFAYCKIDGYDHEYNTINEFSGGRSNGIELFTAKQVQAILDDRLATNSAQASADTERLEFMMERGAWIAWSKDGESCRVFHRKEDGDIEPILGWGLGHWRTDPRAAIDDAMQSTAPASPATKDAP